MKEVLLDGNSLSSQQLFEIGRGTQTLKLTDASWTAVTEGRKVVDSILKEGKVTYGVNTGFGNFADVVINNSQLEQLQRNLILSHSVGVGEPLTRAKTRMLFALRVNVLAKGFSGVSVETLKQVLSAFNKGLLPWVPEKGSVGASGDLCPLAHLALGLIGEGKIRHPETDQWTEAKEVLAFLDLKPLVLKAKEGLALINGTQLITSLMAEAVARAVNCVDAANIIGALTLEALKGTTVAFSPEIHQQRPHEGQIESASTLRSLLHSDSDPSEIHNSHNDCGRVQDSYTLRCMPQVHGVAADTLKFVEKVIHTEINSATDNPMVFAASGRIMSGGNFHGEYPAKMADFLAIAIHELSSISERRIERLCNASLSEGLPPFLVSEGGLNSGFMMAHVTAAALVSENKTLCHPASVDSISTSAAKEDHVSMGPWAARKALIVIENVENVLAIEAISAAQGLDLLSPLKTTAKLQSVLSLIRNKVATLVDDRFMAPDIQAVQQLIQEGAFKEATRISDENSSKSKQEISSIPTKKRKAEQLS